MKMLLKSIILRWSLATKDCVDHTRRIMTSWSAFEASRKNEKKHISKTENALIKNLLLRCQLSWNRFRVSFMESILLTSLKNVFNSLFSTISSFWINQKKQILQLIVNYDVTWDPKTVECLQIGKSDGHWLLFKPKTAFLSQEMRFKKIIFVYDVIVTSPTPL